MRIEHGLQVADCYPEVPDSPGGPRLVPWDAWSTVDDGAGMVQWAALRWPGLDPAACREAARRVMDRSRFSLLPDGRDGAADEAQSESSNCATLLTAILGELGVDLSGIDRLCGIANHTFGRFLGLVEAGFYEYFDCTCSKHFLDLSREYGLIDRLPGQSQMLPPSFAEMLPGFEMAAYGRPAGPHQASIGPWLDFYRHLVPGFRAAVRTHGLLPEQTPSELLRRAGKPFRNAVATLDTRQRIDGPSLVRTMLLQLADSPGPYLSLPMAAWCAMHAKSDLMRHIVGTTSVCAASVLDLAARLGWKPLQLFRRLPGVLRPS
ncbi:hypothetical protein [Desulfovibrio sp. TomC]|uniref:hypothetical protein n=1 Tax=Desulfovibrio sp. TomC TaxID=1562888 RepID=UPI0018CD7470|nr:hypothetical protein [Desulfovibrio sp. TomC]